MVAHEHGKNAVLGGASRINKETESHLKQFSQTLLDAIDCVGFHNLRGT